MRAVIQRVTQAKVTVSGELISEIGAGIVVLLGVEEQDTEEDVNWLASKILSMRIFDDENGVMNLSMVDINANILIVSQFTLFASTRKGNRPSYIRAARPEKAIPLYENFVSRFPAASCGIFGAHMEVALTNDGPVTILIDSKIRE